MRDMTGRQLVVSGILHQRKVAPPTSPDETQSWPPRTARNGILPPWLCTRSACADPLCPYIHSTSRGFASADLAVDHMVNSLALASTARTSDGTLDGSFKPCSDQKFRMASDDRASNASTPPLDAPTPPRSPHFEPQSDRVATVATDIEVEVEGSAFLGRLYSRDGLMTAAGNTGAETGAKIGGETFSLRSPFLYEVGRVVAVPNGAEGPVAGLGVTTPARPRRAAAKRGKPRSPE